MMKFSTIKSMPISQQVADHITKMIFDGELKAGDKLPSERELAKMIGVGRFSLREGLRILESLGTIEVKYGINAGIYISEGNLEQIAPKFSHILKMSNIDIDQLTEARLEIGLINLKYFIIRATEQDFKKLKECHAEAEHLLKSGMETRESNLKFSELIAEGSKNPIFIFIHDALIDVLRHLLAKFVSPHEHSKRVIQHNKKIIKYIEEKNIEKASEALREHIKYTGERLKVLVKTAGPSEQKKSVSEENNENKKEYSL